MGLNKCCLCLDLRTGTLAIAVLSIVFGKISLIDGIYERTIFSITIGVIDWIIYVASGACLLHGAIKYNNTTTMVYLILATIGIISFIVTIPVNGIEGNFALIVYVIGIVTEVYFWICVNSFYKKLKSGEIVSPA